MKENWRKAIAFVLEREGGYSFLKEDPGGETNFGISKRAYPNVDIKALTIDQAKEIYKRDYWNKLNCDGKAYPLDIIMFDTGVNCGVSKAVKFEAMASDWQDYLFLRLEHYANLTSAKHFLRGWTRRVIGLWRLVK